MNYELSIKELANNSDIEKKMEVLVYEKERKIFVCSKCNEKIILDTNIFDELINYNNKIKCHMEGLEINVDNILASFKDEKLKAQLQNFKPVLLV